MKACIYIPSSSLTNALDSNPGLEHEDVIDVAHYFVLEVSIGNHFLNMRAFPLKVVNMKRAD